MDVMDNVEWLALCVDIDGYKGEDKEWLGITGISDICEEVIIGSIG